MTLALRFELQYRIHTFSYYIVRLIEKFFLTSLTQFQTSLHGF